jgi:2,3-bisphosphoglycerate-independent phosphoglycerate mutase
MNTNKAILIIMDGWGKGIVPKADAITAANTPFVDSLFATENNSTLVTCGEQVGLPNGQMGNSEVGHLNLGAGRIVYQELQRINVAINEGSFAKNEILLNAINKAKANNVTLHLIGLVSDGGVHSHTNHIKAITSICHNNNLTNVAIHAFTDGRDTDPKSGIGYITDLQNHLQKTTGEIATITGRYYAMDRDKRWERVKLAYDALVHGFGDASTNLVESIAANYANSITDEFLKPIINSNLTTEKRTIKNGDVVIAFNFRTDRCREITEVLTQKDFPEFGMQHLNVDYTTMTEYDASFNNVHVIFKTDNLENTIGEVIANAGLTQIRIAETEKYPHVSFFFSGGREKEFVGETRLMAPSPKVATYDLQPEMSAKELTNLILPEIEKAEVDFVCLNFANADMVGHTGVFSAVVKAVETVDTCVEKIVTLALQKGYTIFLTADHGNADYMINEDGTSNTAHTLNLVPYWVLNNHTKYNLKPGKLADVAPTILKIMNIAIPKEMTGEVLV